MNSFSIKTKIIYGDNALNYLEKFKDSKVFVVADPYLVESRKIDIVTNHLNIEKSFIFSKVEPDPHTGLIIDGVEDIKAFGPEGIVAVGGGSAIDTAKAIINMAGKLEAKEKLFGLRQKTALVKVQNKNSHTLSILCLQNLQLKA